MSGRPERKIALAATKQVGSSVVRHRYVRKLREFYRLNKDLFAENAHYLLVVRAPVDDWQEFESRVKGLLEKQKTRN